jgi:hypothetical protein
MKKTLAAVLPLVLCVPGLAVADPAKKCNDKILKGEYVLTATGFTRPPGSAPGTPWVPKALVEVIHFNGDGTLTTPIVTVANPFGDVGNVVPPPGTPGAPGTYSINDDCSGTVQFLDANSVAYRIFVDPPEGHTVWMIQSNPANNVIQGAAKRVR